jgi:hypothetical protein
MRKGTQICELQNCDIPIHGLANICSVLMHHHDDGTRGNVRKHLFLEEGSGKSGKP